MPNGNGHVSNLLDYWWTLALVAGGAIIRNTVGVATLKQSHQDVLRRLDHIDGKVDKILDRLTKEE